MRKNGSSGMQAVAVSTVDLQVGTRAIIQFSGCIVRIGELRAVLSSHRFLDQPNVRECR